MSEHYIEFDKVTKSYGSDSAQINALHEASFHMLSIIASILGLPLGKLFHTTVMSMVRIDMITFNDKVEPIILPPLFSRCCSQ